jgi:hypothetical protein
MQAKAIDVKKTGGVGTPQDVIGLNLCDQYAREFLKMLEQDKAAASLVKMLGDELGTVGNEVKGFMQRQAQAAQKKQQSNGAGGVDPKEQAKADAIRMQAQNKIEMGKQSHAAKTAQRQLSWEQQLRQKSEEHAATIEKLDIEAASSINRNRLSSIKE